MFKKKSVLLLQKKYLVQNNQLKTSQLKILVKSNEES